MTSLLEKFREKYGRLPTEVDPDYLEMLRMSKYKILAVPYHKPGKCANCGAVKNDGRGYVDFGLEIDWYGIVYLCGTCLNDVAQNAGLFDKQNERIRELEAENASLRDLKEEGKDLHGVIINTARRVEDYYGKIYTHRNDSDSDISDESNSDSPSSPDLEPSPSTETESRIDESKSGAAKPTSSTRRKDLSSLAELLNGN